MHLPLGNWDLGHKMQLVLSDVFINGDSAGVYSKHVGNLFSLMADWKNDENGMKFREIADELLHPTLQQRGKQETRWARADLAAKEAFFRNSPTIYNCLGREANKFRMQLNTTGQKIIEKKMEGMSDAEMWMCLLGYAQGSH